MASPSCPYAVAPNSNKDLLDEKQLMSCETEALDCMIVMAAGLASDALLYGRVDKRGDGFRISVKLLDANGHIDPDRCNTALMRGEKQGGHGERPGAVGLLDAALWDLRAKQQGLPLWQCLREATGHMGTPAAAATPPRRRQSAC